MSSDNSTALEGCLLPNSQFENFQVLSGQFSKFHEDPQNIVLHLLTTPLGVLGAVCLLRGFFSSTSVVAVLMLTYLFSLMPSLTIGSFVGTAVISGTLLYIARKVDLGVGMSFLLIALGYGLQDTAHYLSGEATFQGSYTKGSGQVRGVKVITSCLN